LIHKGAFWSFGQGSGRLRRILRGTAVSRPFKNWDAAKGIDRYCSSKLSYRRVIPALCVADLAEVSVTEVPKSKIDIATPSFPFWERRQRSYLDIS
jgi:hypothetical protein